LDQCVSAGADGVTRDTVLELLGSPGEEQLALLTDMISDGDISGALLHLNRLLDEGRDERQLIKDWIEHFRNLMLMRHLERPEDMLNMSVENIERLREQCLRLTPAFVNDSIFTLAGTLNDARWTTRPRVLLEIGLIKMAAAQLPGDAAAVSLAPAAKPASARPERAVAKPAPAVASPAATVAEPTMTVAIPERTAAKSEPATEPVLTPESVPTESPVPEEHSPAPMPPATLDWRAVIAEVKKINSVLSRLDNRSSLAEIGRGAFVIEVFDKFTKDVAEDGREQIEAAVARMTGTPLHMDCRLNESADGGQKSARARRKNPPAPAADIAPEPTPDGEETQLQETFDFGAGRD
jgi:DNA polymerase-3 subunit gamma/tau